MKIETKYNLEDIVYFMKNDKISACKISSIEIFHVDSNQKYTKYTGWDIKNPVTWIDHQNLFEKDIFPSLEGLCNSIKIEF